MSFNEFLIALRKFDGSSIEELDKILNLSMAFIESILKDNSQINGQLGADDLLPACIEVVKKSTIEMDDLNRVMVIDELLSFSGNRDYSGPKQYAVNTIGLAIIYSFGEERIVELQNAFINHQYINTCISETMKANVEKITSSPFYDILGPFSDIYVEYKDGKNKEIKAIMLALKISIQALIDSKNYDSEGKQISETINILAFKTNELVSNLLSKDYSNRFKQAALKTYTAETKNLLKDIQFNILRQLINNLMELLVNKLKLIDSKWLTVSFIQPKQARKDLSDKVKELNTLLSKEVILDNPEPTANELSPKCAR